MLPRIKKNTFLLTALSGLILNAASWAWIYVKVPPGSFPFIVHYNIYFGQDLLGERNDLFQVPLMGTAILLINGFLIFSLSKKRHFLLWIVLASTIALELLLLYASGVIVSINS